MKNKIKQLYGHASLATKIRYSYMILLIPIMILLVFCILTLWNSNRKYRSMLNSTAVAGEFSLDFKKDFDYEVYLVIVENKTIEESSLQEMLDKAKSIVDGLMELTEGGDNMRRLESAGKYLDNLATYKLRIEENLKKGNMYETNLEIWENDIQIVTSLVSDTISEYIYYEIKEIQTSHEEYQSILTTITSFAGLASAGILVFFVILSYYIPRSITNPIKRISEITDQVAKGNLSVHSDVTTGAEVSVLSDSLNKMIDKINELLTQVKKEQMRLRKAEFELLQAQINPHFLYNTLDAIVWLAESGEQEKVVSMVGSLSEFFRTSLNQGKDIITIREELVHVRSYLEIQQVRYQDILKYEINVPSELDRYLIPKITLQPLVENAIYHGIKNKRGIGTITISATAEAEGFYIKIADDGIGMDEERLQKVCDKIHNRNPKEDEVFGLYNVNERIILNFGEQYGISVDSTYMKGTTVKIYLPYTEKT